MPQDNLSEIITISGRIKETKQVGETHDGFAIFETQILTPAEDPYSSPPKDFVMSRGRIGDENTDVEIKCQLSRNHSYNKKDKKFWPKYMLWAVR